MAAAGSKVADHIIQTNRTRNLTVLPAGSCFTTDPKPHIKTGSHSRKPDKAEKMLRSPFGVYMSEQRPVLQREGHNFSGWKAVADFLTPTWQAMTEDEQLYFRMKSMELKEGISASISASGFGSEGPPAPVSIQKVIKSIEEEKPKRKTPCGVTTFGEPIIPNYMETMIEYKLYLEVRAKIDLFLHKDKSTALKEKIIAILEFNTYCSDMDGSGDIIPGEWGLTIFSVNDGLKEVMSGLIDPGKTPLGTGSEVKESLKSVGLPSVSTDKKCDDIEIKSGLKSTVNEIISILENWQRNSVKPRLVFSMRENVVITQRCLRWLSKITNVELEVDVLPLSVLMEMYSPLSPQGRLYKRSEVQCDRVLKRVVFAYIESLPCEWHLTNENMNKMDKCARNLSVRQAYNFMDYICPLYEVRMNFPEHTPEHDLVNHYSTWNWTVYTAAFDSGLHEAMSVYSMSSTVNPSSFPGQSSASSCILNESEADDGEDKEHYNNVSD